MGFANFFLFFFLFHPFLLKLADSKCQKSFTCKHLPSDPMEFPLTDYKHPECGLIKVDCDSPKPAIQLTDDGIWYDIIESLSTNRYVIATNPFLPPHLIAESCASFRNMSLRDSPSISFNISSNLTLFKCDNFFADPESIHKYFQKYEEYTGCRSFTVYYRRPEDGNLMEESNNIPEGCSVIQLPMNSSHEDSNDLFKLLSPRFSIEWTVSKDCLRCHIGGGRCVANSNNKFECKKGKSKTKVILAAAIPGGAFIVCLLVSFIIWQRRKRIKDSYLLSRNISSDPSSKSDIEGGSFYFGIPVFSYTELVEATNNFDSSKELGDGGFGTVYYGKLKDGREVAIKRLYEHNYKRVEQFMNEIKILTCLRHPNLVSLYGCTSRRSRELLLVYEYVRNGTVADHLHGERAKEAPLTWAVRMSIAIETASALSYLHKSDIIHRDVKTNNVLLDENCCVKVADFGLSRLFPNDVSHISTAPQGTPGYVDPEYHQCYQLTDKSDVYSFGVVLIELISSMPAVDISRHRHEINLANLALNKIQRCAFDELIDSSLGYDTDIEVTRMTTSVAELAFRCLQLEKEMRPSMDEVFYFLKDIQSGDELKFDKGKEGNGKIPPSPETDDIVLLKNKNFQSPNAVTDKWVSGSSTTASSIE